MKKVLVTSVVTLATALFLSTGHAGNGKHNNGKRGGNGSSAVISYSIDAIDCAVTINSTKDLSNIVLKDSDGNRVKKWDDLDGKSFSDFGMYSALLTDGSLFVKSGNNGKRGKRNRGLGAEIGDDFRDELAACLDVPVVACPEVLTSVIDSVIESGVGSVYNTANHCEIYGAPNTEIGIYNGLSGNASGLIGASYRLPETGDLYQIFVLSLEEANACRLYIGEDTCSEYDSLLP